MDVLVSISRRQLIAGLGPLLGIGLAGCGGDDPAPGLHAVTATIVHRRGFDDFRYPGDVVVRVDVENTAGERLSGTLVVTLERTSAEDAAGPTTAWTRRRNVELQSATTRGFIVGFQDVYREGTDDIGDFRAEAAIRMDDDPTTG